MASPLEALRDALVTRIEADTGAGGLRETSGNAESTAYVHYVSHRIPQDSETYPRIVFDIAMRPLRAIDTQNAGQDIEGRTGTVAFTVEHARQRLANDMGYEKGQNVIERLFTWLHEHTLTTTSGWTFSPLVFEASDNAASDADFTRHRETYSFVMGRSE